MKSVWVWCFIMTSGGLKGASFFWVTCGSHMVRLVIFSQSLKENSLATLFFL